MFRYPAYPNLYPPPEREPLLTVKAPETCHQLDPKTYQELMGERLTWMIWQWMRSDGHSLEETHQILNQFTARTAPAQTTPTLPEERDDIEISMWCEDWAQTLIQGNAWVWEALAQADLPAATLTPHTPNYSRVLDIHNDTQLSTWLDAV